MECLLGAFWTVAFSDFSSCCDSAAEHVQRGTCVLLLVELIFIIFWSRLKSDQCVFLAWMTLSREVVLWIFRNLISAQTLGLFSVLGATFLFVTRSSSRRRLGVRLTKWYLFALSLQCFRENFWKISGTRENVPLVSEKPVLQNWIVWNVLNCGKWHRNWRKDKIGLLVWALAFVYTL